MKQAFGIYLMFGGILIGMYMIFGVYLPSHAGLPAPAAQEISYSEKTDQEILATAKYSHPKKEEPAFSLFTVPDGLKKEVDFWTKIYSVYTSDEAVLHDPFNLGKIYGTLTLPHCDEPPAKECLTLREERIEDEKKKILDDLGTTADEVKIRAQVGQKDKFKNAIVAAQGFLADIEKIFAEYQLPKEISRLPFVESMFNNDSLSHSGAAGIWQLMPSTARLLGLKVTKAEDERRDPVKSTRVAAKHLLRDYKRLGSWPLAVNAYNSGPSRLANAVAVLGTTDIVKIIKNYDNPAYGFAARNFYPCFLAALNIYERRNEYFGDLLQLNGGQDISGQLINADKAHE
ncbi:MAG: lytic transglycosylase domain-containing protein [Deltaproteobacteria bacterium]|nr:lytic transglycosylase domain-containing protein [Deltaproteobacteria bacterium]MBI2342497.1 lytic transglycosylase domain-containing protein [Deltaproteobacteria bacterium]MBI2974000.1 lytic transglycosylase domain-containing protein [Deltaproteobacteria bacterium]